MRTECPKGIPVPIATVCSDGWRGYNRIHRTDEIVLHKSGYWAIDAEGEGLYEIPRGTIRRYLYQDAITWGLKIVLTN